MINKRSLKSIIYATTVFCSVENSFACDNNSDLSSPLSVSARSSYSNCGNISIPDNLITTSATAIGAINVLDLSNSGDITINSEQDMHSYGINNSTNNASLYNSGNIDISTDYSNRNSYGIKFDNHNSFINDGIINVSSKQASTYGVISTDSQYIENNNNINSYAGDGTSYAIRALDMGDAINNADIYAEGKSAQTVSLTRANSFENNAAITAKSTNGAAIAINAYNTNYIYNNGTINVEGLAVSSQGIKTNNQILLENNGDISVTNTNGLSTGINAIDTDTIRNHGNIYSYSDLKSSTALKATKAINVENHAKLQAISNSQITYGIYSLNSDNIENSGGIESTSKNQRAYGIYINGDTDIDNSGQIYANSENSSGYGIFYKNSNAKLSSTNLIDADYAHIFATNSSTIDVSNYALEFNSSQAELDNRYKGMLKYQTGSSILFNNTTLHAFVGDDFVSGTTMDIPVLTENTITGSLDNVSDQFSNAIVAANPDYNVELINGNGVENQKVKLTFKPEESTAPQKRFKVLKSMASNTSRTIKHDLKRIVLPDLNTAMPKASAVVNKSTNNQMQLTGSGFTDMVKTLNLQNPLSNGSILSKVSNTVAFIMPFYSTTTDSSKNSYEADMSGLISGINYILKNGVLAGFHLGYAQSKINYTDDGYETKKEYSENYILGVQAAKQFGNYLLSAVSSFTFLRNNYKDTSSINTENAKYNANSLNTNVELGYIKKFDTLTLIPKLGLNHYWFKSDKYKIYNIQNQDTNVSGINDSNLSVSLGTEVYSKHKIDDLTIKPNLNISIEQLLTNNNLSNTVTAGQTSQTVNTKSDNTILHLGSNITFEKQEHTTTLGFTSSLSNNVKNNTLFLEYKYKF